MSRGRRFTTGMFDLLVGEGECPPHDEDCDVCRLFSHQRPDETPAAWIARITGSQPSQEIAS